MTDQDRQDRIDLLAGRLPRRRNALTAVCIEAKGVLDYLTIQTEGNVPLTPEEAAATRQQLDTLPARLLDAFRALEADRAELYALENPS